MLRNNCIFCDSNNLKYIYTQRNTPIAFYGVDISGDYIFQDNIWLGCINCGIIQLQNLIDPDILYSISHNNTYNTPTWNSHHLLFEEFINKNRKYNSVLEIGGGNGYLASKLYHSSLEYSVLDLFEPTNKIEGIQYKVENCETFNYNNYTSVILSHVFEHLYKPLDFIKRVSLSQVKELFISVPNLKSALDCNSISFIHNEHTFYFEETDLVNIFNKYKYRLQDKLYFNSHSIFFYFVFDETLINIETNALINNRSEQFIQYFINRENKLSTIKTNNPSFIIPSGHFGSVIYSYLKDKTNIIGFLDNDTSKQCKYLYGTDILIYPINHISNYESIDIILHAGLYSNELRTQLIHLNTKINLITF
jgi:hypothetical protein